MGKRIAYKVKWVAVDRETGEAKEMMPHELPLEKQLAISERIMNTLGYAREKQAG